MVHLLVKPHSCSRGFRFLHTTHLHDVDSTIKYKPAMKTATKRPSGVGTLTYCRELNGRLLLLLGIAVKVVAVRDPSRIPHRRAMVLPDMLLNSSLYLLPISNSLYPRMDRPAREPESSSRNSFRFLKARIFYSVSQNRLGNSTDRGKHIIGQQNITKAQLQHPQLQINPPTDDMPATASTWYEWLVIASIWLKDTSKVECRNEASIQMQSWSGGTMRPG